MEGREGFFRTLLSPALAHWIRRITITFDSKLEKPKGRGWGHNTSVDSGFTTSGMDKLIYLAGQALWDFAVKFKYSDW